MAKNLLFLLAAIILSALCWAAFHFLGNFAFIVMLVITIGALLTKVGKPKFGKNK